MAPGPILRHLNCLLVAQSSREQTDAQLLRRFAAQREEAAFAALLSRHGRLVWDVCRHTLGHEHDAEDAFQATFLVLARKAGSIRKGESVGSFLYGVAYRTSLKARHSAAARRAREKKSAVVDNQPPADAGLRELQTILAEEVSRLAPKYRTPFVLCCLEGKSKREAAEELSWKEGTVSSRLAHARKLLQARLTRRGVALTAALTTAALASGSALAVPVAVVAATLLAAPSFAAGQKISSSAPVALTEGVLHAMFVTKLQKLVLLAMVLLVVVGSVAVGRQTLGPKPTVADKAQVEIPKADKPESRRVGFEDNQDSLPPVDKKPERAPSWAEPLKLKGHTSAVCTVAASSDGKLFATGDSDAGLKLWDAHTGELVKTLDPRRKDQFVIQTICGLAFSPDSKTLAVGVGNIGVSLWKVDKGEKLRDLDAGDAERKGMGPLFFAPDGKTLFAGPRYTFHYPETKWPDKIGPVFRTWDTEKGKLLRTFGGDDGFWTMAMSRDGKLLASGAVKKVDVVIWDADTGKEVGRFKHGGTGTLNALAFAPDGKAVAVGTATGTVELRDVKTGAEIQTFPEAPSKNRINGLAFANDGKLLAVASGAGNVAVFDPATGNSVGELKGPEGAVESVTFAAKGYDLLAGGADRAAWLWKANADGPPQSGNVPPPKEVVLEGHKGAIGAVAYSSDGHTVATGSADGVVRLWDTRTGETIRTLDKQAKAVAALTFSPDGKRLAVGCDRAVRLYEVDSGDKVRDLDVPVFSEAYPLRFAPDGATLFSGPAAKADAPLKDGHVAGWDLRSGKESRGFPLPTDGRAAAFSADGTLAATVGGSDGRIMVVETRTGTEVASFHGEFEKTVTVLEFSPDGSTLAIGGSDGKVRLLALKGGKDIWKPEGISVGKAKILALACAPGGKRLAVTDADGGVTLLDAETGNIQARLKGHEGAVTSAAFAPDGYRLLTGGADRTVRLWVVRTEAAVWTAIDTLPGRKSAGPINEMAFAPDGKTFAFRDRRATVLELKTKKELALYDGLDKTAIWLLGFTRDSTPLLLRNEGSQTVGGRKGDWRLVLFDPVADKVRATFDQWPDVGGLAFALNPDGDLFVVSPWTVAGPLLRFMDAKTGKELAALPYKRHPVYSLAFSADGKTLAGIVDSEGIKLWDVAKREERRTIDDREVLSGGDKQKAPVLAADGKTLACFARSSPKDPVEGVKLYDTATGKSIAFLQAPDKGASPSACAFAPDGKMLLVSWWQSRAVADSKPRLAWYDVAMGKEIGVLPSDKEVTALAFSADGKLLATGDVENTIRWWAKK